MSVCKESRAVSERVSRRAHISKDRTKAHTKARTVKEKQSIKEKKIHKHRVVKSKNVSLNEGHVVRIENCVADMKGVKTRGKVAAKDNGYAVKSTGSGAAVSRAARNGPAKNIAVNADVKPLINASNVADSTAPSNTVAGSNTEASSNIAVGTNTDAGSLPPAASDAGKTAPLKSFDIHSIEDNPFAEEIPEDASMSAMPEVEVQSTVSTDSAMPSSQPQQQPSGSIETPALGVQNTPSHEGSIAANTNVTAESITGNAVSGAVPVLQGSGAPAAAVNPAGSVPVAPALSVSNQDPKNLAGTDAPAGVAQTTVSGDTAGGEQDNIVKLKEQIVQLEESIMSLHQMYMDGIIAKSRYDSAKEHMEDNIREDNVHISIETQRTALNNLKEVLDRDVEAALNNKEFHKETETIRNDLERLERLREYKVIDDETYELSKSNINKRMERMSTLITEINRAVDMDFERYSASFGNESHDGEEENKESGKSVETEGEGEKKAVDEQKVAENKEDNSKRTIIQKVLGLLKIGKKQKQGVKTASSSNYRDELEKISKIEPKRDALIELQLLLKKEIQKKHNIDKQLTYEQLIPELSKIKADEKFKAELISFFKETSDSEYTGVINADDFTNIYNTVVGYMNKIEGLTEQNVPEKKDKKGKKIEKKK